MPSATPPLLDCVHSPYKVNSFDFAGETVATTIEDCDRLFSLVLVVVVVAVVAGDGQEEAGDSPTTSASSSAGASTTGPHWRRRRTNSSLSGTHSPHFGCRRTTLIRASLPNYSDTFTPNIAQYVPPDEMLLTQRNNNLREQYAICVFPFGADGEKA